jgi:tRNA-splicing ligase RtcB (3'-phosphate/5'-hydroxy nucleic acid ligase)
MRYRRLADVLAHHSASVRVLHRLKPSVVVMAGEAEADPFKH